jgi:hypothetical protein
LSGRLIHVDDAGKFAIQQCRYILLIAVREKPDLKGFGQRFADGRMIAINHSVTRDSVSNAIPSQEAAMQGETRERWLDLCMLAAEEQDPVKMLALITEINDLLEAKEERLKQKRAADPYTRERGEC